MEQALLQKHYKEKVEPRSKKSSVMRTCTTYPRSQDCDQFRIRRVLRQESRRLRERRNRQDRGQRPIITKAKLSISNFKLREGQPIGCKVTLRGRAMYDFMLRLINVLPCIRDFRGVPTKFDGQGNYARHRRSHDLPEVSAEGTSATIGMDISFATAKTDEVAANSRLFGMPFRKSSSSWPLKKQLPRQKQQAHNLSTFLNHG